MFLRVNNFLGCLPLEKGCYVVGYVFAAVYGSLTFISLAGLIYVFSVSYKIVPGQDLNRMCTAMLLLLVVALPLWYVSILFVRGIKAGNHIEMSMFPQALAVQIVMTLMAMFFAYPASLIFHIAFIIVIFYIIICVHSLCESVKDARLLEDGNCYQVNIVTAFEKAQVRV